jgi:DNA-binding beta-propeller fold protein YncE
MIMARSACFLLAAILLLGACNDVPAAEESSSRPPLERLFRLVTDVPLGPSMSRIDYQSLDPTTGRLFIAGMGAGTLIVFDSRSRDAASRREGFPKATGVLAVPERGKLYVSVPGGGVRAALSVALGWVGLSSGAGRLAILDLASLREIARVPAGVFPDGIAYDPTEDKIFVSDEIGGALTAIDARADRTLTRIALGGEAGNVRYDPTSRRIYVPVQSRDELAAIDPKTDRVVARFPLPGGQHPHGLIIAPGAAIGYVACDADDVLLTVDLQVGAVLASTPLGRDPDVLALDPAMQRLYVAAESGLLASFDISDPRLPRSLGTVYAGPHAHSVAVDAQSHALFLPLAELEGRAVMRILQPRPVTEDKP